MWEKFTCTLYHSYGGHATHTTRQRKHIKESTPAGGCPVVDGNRFPERKKERKKERKTNREKTTMKLILVKLITCGLPWSPPTFSIDNECHLQISFDVGEIHLYTLSLL
jgi:hypothetical protein